MRHLATTLLVTLLLLFGGLAGTARADCLAGCSLGVTQDDLAAAAASNLAAMAAAVPGLAPVQSVNGGTGAVIVPTFQRKLTDAGGIALTAGVGTWTFTGTPFTSVPTCLAQITSATTTYVFAAPQITAISTTSVTVRLQAALNTLNISLGAPAIWGSPPAGTTLGMLCLAPI